MPTSAPRRRSPHRPRLAVTVTAPDGATLATRGLGKWLTNAAPADARGEVTVALVSDGRMRALNRSFRGKDYATDVLSFPAQTAADDSGAEAAASAAVEKPAGTHKRGAGIHKRGAGPHHRSAGGNDRRTRDDKRGARPIATTSPAAAAPAYLGDIVIATGVANRQADDARHPVSTELKVLALHGLLHLLGYDHETDGGEMARAEGRLRKKAGLKEGLISRTSR